MKPFLAEDCIYVDMPIGPAARGGDIVKRGCGWVWSHWRTTSIATAKC